MSMNNKHLPIHAGVDADVKAAQLRVISTYYVQSEVLGRETTTSTQLH